MADPIGTPGEPSHKSRWWRSRHFGWRLVGVGVLLVAGYLLIGHYGLS
jgi:hypothetical protein